MIKEKLYRGKRTDNKSEIYGDLIWQDGIPYIRQKAMFDSTSSDQSFAKFFANKVVPESVEGIIVEAK